LEDEDIHKDLQTSIEQSGMDVLVLTEVFRALKNLRIVHIDVISYYYLESEAVQNGIKCGRGQLFKGDVPGEDARKDRGGDHGASRVYDLVMQALENSNARDEVELHLQFWSTLYSTGELVCFLDLDSRAWQDHFSKQVR
jgi:hypothetical protein